MSTEHMALVRGWADTRATLRGWQHQPGPVVGAWVAASMAIAATLLTATWMVGILSVPDPTVRALLRTTCVPFVMETM